MSSKRVGRSVFIVSLALALLAMGSWAQGQLPCTVTVKPGESIQSAIDGAKEGAVICLGAGRYEGNITIKKGLTLRGTGAKREGVRIVGVKEGYPVMRIESEEEIEVQIENLSVAWAKGDDGVQVVGKAKAVIRDVHVSGNLLDGLSVVGSARVSLTNSQVSGNGEYGLVVGGSAKVDVRSSTIEGNGTHPECRELDYICNGITVWDESQTTITDSKIRNNTDWGVAAALKKCGYDGDYFSGRVVFQDTNVIEGNNKSGNHEGNPGWSGPPLPDGQVCLP